MRRSLTTAVAFAAWLAVAGCGGDASERARPETADPRRGGTAVVAVRGEPDVLNPLIRVSAAAGRILAEIGAKLTVMDEDLVYRPRIARGWEIAPDGRAITYRLRPWWWSDGTPLTAHDVVLSLRLIQNPRLASPLAGYVEAVAGAVALDDSTVRYDFVRAPADPLTSTHHDLVPRHVVADLDPAAVGSWPLNQRPLASGPFRFADWERNRQIVIERNPHYPLDPPLLDRVVFRVLPEAETRLLALEAGEVDLVETVSPSDAKRLERGGEARVHAIGGRQVYYVQWNCERPQFADATTRRALSLAIDRERMIATLLGGYARPAVGPIAPAVWNHHDGLPADPHAPDRARRLLAAAGWRDDDGDGTLERDGRELGIEIIARQGDPVRENGAVMLREALAAVGAEVAIRILERGVVLERWERGEFDAHFGLMNLNLYGDPTPLVHSGARDRFNKGGFAHAGVDSLLALALAEPRRQRARPHWYALQELLARQAPAAWLFNPQILVGVGPRLRDVRPHMLSPINNLAEWWIAPEDRRYRGE